MDIFISHKTALGIYFLAQARGEGELYRLLRPLADDPIHASVHGESRGGTRGYTDVASGCAIEASLGGGLSCMGEVRGDMGGARGYTGEASVGMGLSCEGDSRDGTGGARGGISRPIVVNDARNDVPQLTLASAAARARDMNGLDLDFLEVLPPGKIDVLVPGKNQCHTNPTIRQHVWSGPIPPGAFFKLAEHVYISSPEFVLLHMAAELDRYQTLQLAMQLCGTFALQHGVEHDMVQHPQLTKKERLELFVQGVAGRRIGMGNYRWAVRHVLSGAASTTESGIALLLSMPSNTGAFGLRAFQLNVEKRYGPIEREIAGGKERCFVDLLDEETRFGWEYQGKEGHSDAEGGVPYGQASRAPGSAGNDSAGSSVNDLDFTLSYGAERLDADTRKLAALAHMKYDVRPLVWGQIKTVRDFTHVARATAEAFGVAPDELYAFSDDPRLLDRRERLHRSLILRRYYWQDT